MSVKEINEKQLSKLNSKFADHVRKVIDNAEAEGVTLQIVQGLRTVEEQDKLFAKGRTAPGKIVTKARGGKSWHNYGLAVDLAPVINGKVSWSENFDWSIIGKLGKKEGLFWGGDWKNFQDRPHLEYTRGYNSPSEALRLYQRTKDLKAVWKALTWPSVISTVASTLITDHAPQQIEPEDENIAIDLHEKEIQVEESLPATTEQVIEKTETPTGSIQQTTLTTNEQDVNKPALVELPKPSGFLTKVKVFAGGLTGLGISVATVKEVFGITLSPGTVELLKFILPTLFYGTIGLLIVWYVVNYLKGRDKLKHQVQANADTTKKDVVFVESKEDK